MTKLNPNYSTTRLVTHERPTIEEPPGAAFKTVLFLPEGEGRQGEGGLRTQGYFKRSLPDKPLITVITVVFNGAQHLEETILSVIGQTYDNVEYIIIDGGSTDGTLDIIRKYEHAVDYWMSEKDEGIYDAMNKGIDLASGEWSNFMNAGDRFYSNPVISDIFKEKIYTGIEVIYGRHEVRYSSGRKRIPAKTGELKSLWKGSQFSHQSSFVITYSYKKYKFNCCSKIVADFEFFYLGWKNNMSFYPIRDIVSSIEAGGISDFNRIDTIIGFWGVVDKKLKVNLFYLISLLRELVKEIIKKVVR